MFSFAMSIFLYFFRSVLLYVFRSLLLSFVISFVIISFGRTFFRSLCIAFFMYAFIYLSLGFFI